MLQNTFRRELKFLFFGGFLSLVIISIILYHKAIPDISLTLSYRADSALNLAVIQRLKEGWIINNNRSGFPFGSNLLDFPIPDFFELFALKAYTLMGFSSVETLNLFYLTGFFLCFITTYLTLRCFHLNNINSLICAILYDFVPFHFLRIPHLFYTWYFVIPLYILIAYKIYFDDYLNRKKIILYFLSLSLLATTGVYYALFGIITITTATISKFIKTQSTQILKKSIFLNSGIILGVILASSPYIIHKFVHTPNPNAVIRTVNESELYGFKMVQLLLPQNEHRNFTLRKIKEDYNNNFFLNNENSIASLGLISSIGFIIALTSIFLKLSNSNINPRIQFFSLLTLVYFLFGTIGGLGVIFSTFVTPLIRGWNRISIFINLTTLIIFFICIENLLLKLSSKLSIKNINVVHCILGTFILLLGLYDQIPTRLRSRILEVQTVYQIDKKFIESIEASIPANSAIYQLPYMQFPEVPDLYQLQSYDLLSGFTFSKNLKWSFGGIKGREGDLFYQKISKLPLKQQVSIIKKMGFSGIYIDLRGYQDNGQQIKSEFSKIIGMPLLTREDNLALFYKL